MNFSITVWSQETFSREPDHPALKTVCKGNYKSHASRQGERTASLHLTSSAPDSPGFVACGSRQASQKQVSGYIHLFSLLFLCFSRTTGIGDSPKLKDKNPNKALYYTLNFPPGKQLEKKKTELKKKKKRVFTGRSPTQPECRGCTHHRRAQLPATDPSPTMHEQAQTYCTFPAGMTWPRLVGATQRTR